MRILESSIWKTLKKIELSLMSMIIIMLWNILSWWLCWIRSWYIYFYAKMKIYVNILHYVIVYNYINDIVHDKFRNWILKYAEKAFFKYVTKKYKNWNSILRRFRIIFIRVRITILRVYMRILKIRFNW